MCPICKTNEKKEIGLPDIAQTLTKVITAEYKVVQCNNCSFYFLDPDLNLSSDQLSLMYNETYFPPMSHFYKYLRNKDRIKRFNKISKLCKNKIKNFLDIGCGEGYSLIEAFRRGWKAYGIDIFDNRVDDAVNITENFTLAKLTDSKLPDSHFDAIYIDSVLEHITNPLEYLMEMKRILKKDGIIYIGVPNEDCLFNDIKRFIYNILLKNNKSSRLKPFKSPYHIGGFSKKSLLFAVETAGLKPLVIRNFAGRLNFLNPKIFSREFWIGIALLPINIISMVIRREEYLEAYIKNSD